MKGFVESKPSDVWVKVDSPSTPDNAKYYSMMSYVTSPFGGTSGHAVSETRFNLTAYVRDMIAEAMK